MLVGRKEEEAQEQIVGSMLNNIALRKGQKFHLKLMKGGGSRGQGKEVTVGAQQEATPILPIEVFQEIRRCLNESKKKMQEMCQIMRKHKVRMTPNVREKKTK